MIELKPCPFCGSPAVMHETEFPPESTKDGADIPRDARVIKTIKFPDGHSYMEFRRRAFVPQCSVTCCVGRTRKMFEWKADAIYVWNRRAHDV